MSQSIARAGSSLDLSPAAIGGLFRKAHATHIESVQLLIECGRLLKAKKDSLGHREWLPWLEANHEALGFGARAAQLLMKAATNSNPQLTSDLTPADALRINRNIWGNGPKKKAAEISHQADATPKPIDTGSAVPDSAQPPQVISEITEPGYEPWTEADQKAEMERMDREHEIFLEGLKAADDPRSVLYAEIERQKAEIAVLRVSRDGFMNGKTEVTRLLKTEQNRTTRLRSRISELERQITDRNATIQKLQSDNDALRERVSIMEETAP